MRGKALTVTDPLLFLKSPLLLTAEATFVLPFGKIPNDVLPRRSPKAAACFHEDGERSGGGRNMQLQLERSTSVDARNLHRSHIRNSSSVVFAVASRTGTSRQDEFYWR